MEDVKSQDVIEDKTFASVKGTIVPESFVLENLNKFSFEFVSETGKNKFSSEDKRVISKLCSLLGISYMKITQDARNERGEMDRQGLDEIQDFIGSTINGVGRTFVLLLGQSLELVSIVSEQHKQMPLSKAYEIMDSVAKDKGAKFISKTETRQGSYSVQYQVGQNPDMAMTVTAYLGKNSALGKSGLAFIGGGRVFVCSNMIVPHIDADVKFSSDSKLASVKLVHTTGIDDRLRTQLIKSFESAQKNSELLGKAFVASKAIPMSRQLQVHCVDLMHIKMNMPEKWVYEVKRQLRNETETLYGLSQALTWVGTHRAVGESTIASQLQKLGGQVVLLGDKFVELIEKSIKSKGLEVPVLKTQASF
jgi:hypothetical protein